jgi:hypothetical protein
VSTTAAPAPAAPSSDSGGFVDSNGVTYAPLKPIPVQKLPGEVGYVPPGG